MAQVYTVTASTSVVLVNALQSPNTVVLLSSINYPGHIVGIQDTTGSPLISGTPIIVSTMAGVSFYDGTSSILINRPNDILTVSSWTSNTWQILNNIGFLNTLSNAFLEQLTVQNAYTGITSSILENVSTLDVNTINILNSIRLEGNAVFSGDIVIGGSATFFSTMQVNGDLYLSSSWVNGGIANFGSSVSIQGPITVVETISTFGSAIVNESLYVSSQVFAQGALLSKQLSVATLTMDSINAAGAFITAGGVSSLNSYIGADLFVQGSGHVADDATVLATTIIQSTFSVQTDNSVSTLAVNSGAEIQGNINVRGTSYFENVVSSLANVYVSNTVAAVEHTLVKESVYVDVLKASTINVLGNGIFSSLTVGNTMYISQNVYSYGSNINVRGNFIVGGDFNVAGDFYTNSNSQVIVNNGISSIGDMNVAKNLQILSTLFVNSNVYTANDLQFQSTLLLADNVSTNFLYVTGDITVVGNLFAEKSELKTSTLGAPIDLSISTLTLSNTLFVQSRGDIPYLEFNKYPYQILIGSDSNNGEELYINGELNLQNVFAPSTLYATNVRASTLINTSLFSSMIIGPQDFSTSIFYLPAAITVGASIDTNIFIQSSTPQLVYSLDTSTWLSSPTVFSFPPIGSYNIAFNSNLSRYVVTLLGGGGGGVSLNNIAYSDDGLIWNYTSTSSNSVSLNNIKYGGDKFVATNFADDIFYSADGISWTYTSASQSIFFEDIAYSPTLSNWVVVGRPGSGSNAVEVSPDGITWSPVTISNVVNFYGTAVSYGNGKYLAAGYDEFQFQTRLLYSADGSNWDRYMSNFFPTYAGSLANNGTTWVLGRNLYTFGQATQESMYYSVDDGSNWSPLDSGGFDGQVNEVIYDTNFNRWIAVGQSFPAFSDRTGIQTSIDGKNWGPPSSNDFADLVKFFPNSITQGTVPSQENSFVFNLPTVISQTLSTYTMTVSTIQASSFTGTFIGDGAGLSNAENFSLNAFTRTISTINAYTFDISSNIITTNNMSIANTLFLSTLRNQITFDNITVATGKDRFITGNIKAVVNTFIGLENTGTPTFSLYGNKVAGNFNNDNPFFVAVGADTRSSYTILHSVDKINWFPANTGGFPPNSEGICEALDVTYNTTTGRWVVCGSNPGSSDTILYSDDGSNWTTATNAFSNITNLVFKGSNTLYVASGGNGTFPQVKYSISGDVWINANATPLLGAIGQGPTSAGQNSLLASEKSSTTLSLSLNGAFWSTISGTNTQGPITSLKYFPEFINPFTNVPNAFVGWYGAGNNIVQTSPTGTGVWVITASFPSSITINDIVNNNGALVIANTAPQANSTILAKGDKFSPFIQPPLLEGFQPTPISTAAGYVALSYNSGTPFDQIITGGTTQNNSGTGFRPQIFQLAFAIVPPSASPSMVITSSNSQSDFLGSISTSIRDIVFTSNETFPFVFVGDGEVPQKTIARSYIPLGPSPPTNQILPALLGGFSTTGYGVAHFADDPGATGLYIAVGDSDSILNTIQYSTEGANWFGTNDSGGLRQGGRGVGRGIPPASLFVATGKDNDPLKTIAYSASGYNWSTIVSGGFSVQGNRIKALSSATYQMIYAVGEDATPNKTIQYSGDGSNWSNVSNTYFKACYDIDLYDDGLGNRQFLAVGEPLNSIPQLQFPLYTIQTSSDGLTWSPIAGGGFTGIGYSITFANTSLGQNYWVAVGRDIDGNSSKTILSATGGLCNTFSNSSNIVNETDGYVGTVSPGSAKSLLVLPQDQFQYFKSMSFSNMYVQLTESNTFQSPNIHYFSTNLLFNDNFLVTLDNKVGVNFDETIKTITPQGGGQVILDYSGLLRGSNDLTVRGNVYIQNLLYEGGFTSGSIGSTLSTLSLLVSTFVNEQTFIKEYVTPYLFMGFQNPQYTEPKANEITYSFNKSFLSGSNLSTQVININNTLYASEYIGNGVTKDGNLARYTYVGINNSSPQFNLDVNGIAAFSTISTNTLLATNNIIASTSVDSIYLKDDDLLAMYSGTSLLNLSAKNTIYTEPSSITFNSIFTVNLSTQKVGCFTQNPLFLLDDRAAAVIGSLSTPTLRTNSIFLNLQSI